MLAADVIVLLTAAAFGLAAGRGLGLPPILTYLLTGVLVGPAGAGLVGDTAEIHALAELGVALLLFGIGVELSLDAFRGGLGRMLLAGGLQVGITAAASTALLVGGGMAPAGAVVAGFAVSLSSTAIVFKLYDEAGEVDAPQGRTAAAFLLVQDLALVPMMLLVPALANPPEDLLSAAARALGIAGATLAVLLAAARWMLPPVLDRLARTGVPEVFPLTALVVAFGTALVARTVGLSLPIGALLAGLAVSGSRYAHQLFAELLPLRDAFVAVFFTSIGMLLRPAVLASEAWLIATIVALVVAKAALIAGIVAVLWRSSPLGLQTGVALAQLGEFAFVLTAEGAARELLDPGVEQALLATTIVTMAATPFLVRAGRRLAASGALAAGAGTAATRHGHVLVLGCGETGAAVARVLRETGIPYVAVDALVDQVERAHAEGLVVHFGDASRRAVLDEVQAAHARAAVVTVGDPSATRRIVTLLRRMNHHARVIVRARRVGEIAELERLGADEVVPSEFETSIELFARLLRHLGVPRHVVRIQEGLIRTERYRALRGLGTTSELLADAKRVVAGGILETAEVLPGSAAAGRTLSDVALSRSTGAMVLSIVRDERPLPAPQGDTRLEPGDLVVLFGPHEAIARALELLEPVDTREAADD